MFPCWRHQFIGSSASSQVVSQVAQWVKNLPAMQKTQEDVSLIPGSGGAPGGGHGNQLQYSFLLEEPPTEEPGRLQSIGSQRVRHNWSNWARRRAASFCLTQRFCLQGASKSPSGLLKHRSLGPTPVLTKCLSGENAAASGPQPENHGTGDSDEGFQGSVGLPS